MKVSTVKSTFLNLNTDTGYEVCSPLKFLFKWLLFFLAYIRLLVHSSFFPKSHQWKWTWRRPSGSVVNPASGWERRKRRASAREGFRRPATPCPITYNLSSFQRPLCPPRMSSKRETHKFSNLNLNIIQVICSPHGSPCSRTFDIKSNMAHKTGVSELFGWRG